MTIDEAIKQFKEDAEYNRADLDMEWAEENEQVAKWLEELKDYRDKNKMVVKVDVMNIQELKDKIPEAYEKGRADKYQEIVSEYMLLTEKQVAEIRADAIEEFAKAYEHVEFIGCEGCKHLDDNVHCWECIAEQLKEKK